MTENLQLMAVRAAIFVMPDEERRAVENEAEFLRDWLKKDTQQRALALALVLAEVCNE